jgi:cell division septation protein DedD
MKLTCPRCGSENEVGEAKDARRRACASCGEPLRAGARRASEYDGYAVGRRVLKAVPAWLVLCLAGFVLALLLFSWASRPVGRSGGAREDAFRNEATNRPAPQQPATPAPRVDSKREEARGAPTPAAAGADEASHGTADEVRSQAVSEAEEAASFSVQAGAFDDRSQANELVSRLRAAGFDARVVEADASRRFRFQVRSGLFRTREEAARLAAGLRSKDIQTVIVEPDGLRQK